MFKTHEINSSQKDFEEMKRISEKDVYGFEDYCTIYGWNIESNNARAAYYNYVNS